MAKELKTTYFKEVTANYNDIIKYEYAYCVYCYGLSSDLNECKINIKNIEYISDKTGLTGLCKLCSVDAVISKSYFINKSDDVIKGELKLFYDTFFTPIRS